MKYESENIDFVVENSSLVIECKGMKTDLDEKQYRRYDTPMKQLWDYMGQGEWGIVTNYSPINISKEDEVAECVERLLDTQGSDQEAVQELDELFYQIFGLDQTEIEMVEDSFP